MSETSATGGTQATTPKKNVRSCSTAECKARMSSLDIDPHLICVSCRGGRPCNLDERCVTCVDWSDERMNAYVKRGD